MEEFDRELWITGNKCEIYSRSKQKWYPGRIDKIFTDEEGEWLEIRYGKSMTKQVQRYSADIRPYSDPSNMFNFHDLVLNRQDTQTLIAGYNRTIGPSRCSKEINVICFKFLFFVEEEDTVRRLWDKGDVVEVHSNTDHRWNVSEIVDIINDEEGEWLNCVWYRFNGQTMSKEVQRFSTDVRPIPDRNQKNRNNNNNHSDNTNITNDNHRNAFANLFPKSLRRESSASLLRHRKLPDVLEIEETDQYIADNYRLYYRMKSKA
eukprot:269746_1